MDDAVLTPTRHKLDREEYQRMGEAGIFGGDDRIELVEGVLLTWRP